VAGDLFGELSFLGAVPSKSVVADSDVAVDVLGGAAVHFAFGVRPGPGRRLLPLAGGPRGPPAERERQRRRLGGPEPGATDPGTTAG
jgi:hypothetical protein